MPTERHIILRPVGILGDESDATLVEGTRTNGFISLPDTNGVALGDATLTDGETVLSVTLYGRATWSTNGAGPIDPSLFLSWRVSPEPFVDGDPYFPPASVFTEIALGEQDERPGGGAWTLADVNAIDMRLRAFCSDMGSGASTNAFLSDVWADVRVLTPDVIPPDVPPTVAEPDSLFGTFTSANIESDLSGGPAQATIAIDPSSTTVRGGPAFTLGVTK